MKPFRVIQLVKDAIVDNDLPQTDEYVNSKIDTSDVKLLPPAMVACFFMDLPMSTTKLTGYYNVTKQNLDFAFFGNRVPGTYFLNINKGI